ncbi:MAG TPA: hypothetical protein VLW53_03320 [Candidatus Eisenbacteria bacterium]|nr:hypothetical protein [Candidatus Eisenbacteria bacterium]
MATPLPVLGFREWVVGRDGLVSSIRGEPWPTAVAEATCEAGHAAPADDCRCGIYAIECWPRLGDERLYEEAAAPMRLMAQALLSAAVVAGIAALLAMDRPLVARGSWLPACVIGLAMALGLAGVVAADLAIMRPAYVLGAVLLSGRVLRYENGVLRAEQARIACLVRAIGVRRRPTATLAGRLGVPVFHWYERERALRYLSEHGDPWARSAGRL